MTLDWVNIEHIPSCDASGCPSVSMIFNDLGFRQSLCWFSCDESWSQPYTKSFGCSHRVAYVMFLWKMLQLQCCSMLLAAIWANHWACLSSQSTDLGPKRKHQDLGFAVMFMIPSRSRPTTPAGRKSLRGQGCRWVCMRLLVFGVAHFILAFAKSFHAWYTPSTSVYLVNASRRLEHQQQ